MTWKTRPRSNAQGLAAITVGKGPKMLLVHGVGLQGEAWGAQLDALADSFRVTAMDMPGHGASRCLPTTAVLADYTDAIVAALDTPAVVVGHSFGAMIALDMAIRYPEQVAGVAALNAIYRRDEDAKAGVRARANSLDGVSIVDPTAALERWFGSDPSPERDACRDWLCAVDPEGYRRAYTVFAHEDGPSDQGLQGLRCPALFVTGGRESNSTPLMSTAMAALAPQGKAEIFPSAAHMLPMTHAPQVNVILAQFAQRAFS